MANLRPGLTISHYRIKELIARGGMGEVYKAVDTRLGRVVAIKIPSAALSHDEKTRRRFLREAHAASQLSHPGICTIFEIGEEGGQPFIVMEYIEGKTLRELIAAGPLPTETAVAHAIQIADALGEAHRHGIIHRDLKPSNIMINRRGMAVILDFGLAKRLRDLEPVDTGAQTLMASVTTEAAVVGTISYMSPEQVRGKTLDVRSDIFSFGTLFFEMLTGGRPFKGPSQVEIMHAILHSEPSRGGREPSGLDPELDRITRKAMQKDPHRRYDSMTDLKMDLWRFVRAQGYDLSGAVTVSSRSLAAPSTAFGAAARRALTWRTAPLWAAGVLLLGGMAWWLWPEKRVSVRDLIPSLRQSQVVNWKSDLQEDMASWARFSRDGRQIAFTSTRGGHQDVWVKQIQGGEPINVTRDRWFEYSPVWSPDGQRIAFLSDRGDQRGIWAVPFLGGTPELLKKLEGRGERIVAWSRDGATIYFALGQNLIALDLASRQTRQVTQLDAGRNIGRSFGLSPDESQVVYLDRQNDHRDLYVMPVGGGAGRRITDDAAEDADPVWHADGKRVVYSSDRGGLNQLCVAYLDGRAPEQLTFNNSDSEVLDISPDGTRILYATAKDDVDLWALRLETPRESRVTSEVGADFWPDISRDETVAFQARGVESTGNRVFTAALLARPAAADGQQTRLAAEGFTPRWSPDGSQLAFLRAVGGTNGLWTVGAVGGEPRLLVPAGVAFGGFSPLPYNQVQACDFDWSPDGRRIAYVSVNSGPPNLWAVGADGSGGEQLSDQNDATAFIYSPMWSPDGGRIAYLLMTRGAGNKFNWGIWLSESGKSRLIHQSDSTLRLAGWLASGRELLVETIPGSNGPMPRPADVELLVIAAGGRQARTVARLPGAYFVNLRLSPDRRTVAYAARAEGEDRIRLVPLTGGGGREVARSNDPRVYYSGLVWSPGGKTIYYGKQSNLRLISMIENFR